ncbi:MAG: TIGR03936 family radical SAM-associated protein [Anaerolineaceae bacterium]
MQRIRIAYGKGIELQYTGNLDMHRVWERTFRRAKLPLAYSQGFHPQPKLQQAAPLPLGFTSNAEILDIWLDTDEPISELTKKIVITAQPGITINEIKSVPLQSDPLPNLVIAAEYRVICDDPIDSTEIQSRVDELLSQTRIDRERRSKPYDLRPLVQWLRIENFDPIILKMRLTSLPGATGRPEEVLEELHIDPYSVDIERTLLVLNNQLD